MVWQGKNDGLGNHLSHSTLLLMTRKLELEIKKDYILLCKSHMQLKNLIKLTQPTKQKNHKKQKGKKKENSFRTQPSPHQQLARGRRVTFQDTQCQSGKSWCM